MGWREGKRPSSEAGAAPRVVPGDARRAQGDADLDRMRWALLARVARVGATIDAAIDTEGRSRDSELLLGRILRRRRAGDGAQHRDQRAPTKQSWFLHLTLPYSPRLPRFSHARNATRNAKGQLVIFNGESLAGPSTRRRTRMRASRSRVASLALTNARASRSHRARETRHTAAASRCACSFPCSAPEPVPALNARSAR
jgi:hypothetical protein